MPPAINRTMTPAEWGLLIALAAVWGGSFFFQGIAVTALPPLTIVALRVSIAAILLLIVVRASGFAMPRGGKVWRSFFGMSLINNILPFSLIVWGQTQIESGLAAILNATTPLFGVIVAHYFTTDERMTPNRLAGVLIGFAGVVVMIGADALAGIGGNILAQLAILGASVSYAFASVLGRRFNRMGVPPLVTAAGIITAAAVLTVPLALIADHPWTLPMPPTQVWLAVLGLAAISTAFAYILYFRILATAGATNLMLVTLLIPVGAILLGTTFLGERLAASHFLGMGIIAVGLAAIDGRMVHALAASFPTRHRR